MSDRIAQISKIAMDYAAEQYGPQRAGEKVWDPLTYDRKFAELIIQECLDVVSNKCASPTAYDALTEHFNIMAGADHMSDKGYQIGTQEGYEAFVSKRNAGS